MNGIAERLTVGQKEIIDRLGTESASGRLDARAETAWSDLVAAVAKTPADVNALVQFLLRSSYLEATEDLLHYASKVRFYNDQKNALRENLDKMRAAKEPAEIAAAIERLQYETRVLQRLVKEAQDLDREMSDLQAALERQAQLMEMMSSIQKMMNDTAMAIIRNMK